MPGWRFKFRLVPAQIGPQHFHEPQLFLPGHSLNFKRTHAPNMSLSSANCKSFVRNSILTGAARHPCPVQDVLAPAQRPSNGSPARPPRLNDIGPQTMDHGGWRKWLKAECQRLKGGSKKMQICRAYGAGMAGAVCGTVCRQAETSALRERIGVVSPSFQFDTTPSALILIYHP
jgi:hypothetical protein